MRLYRERFDSERVAFRGDAGYKGIDSTRAAHSLAHVFTSLSKIFQYTLDDPSTFGARESEVPKTLARRDGVVLCVTLNAVTRNFETGPLERWRSGKFRRAVRKGITC